MTLTKLVDLRAPIVAVVLAADASTPLARPMRAARACNDVLIARSIRLGLDAAFGRHPNAAGVTFFACDDRPVDRAHVEMLLMAFRSGCAPIVASAYSDHGHPVVGLPALFGRSVVHELRGLSGDSDARTVIAKDASRVAIVPVSVAPTDARQAASLSESEASASGPSSWL